MHEAMVIFIVDAVIAIDFVEYLIDMHAKFNSHVTASLSSLRLLVQPLSSKELTYEAFEKRKFCTNRLHGKHAVNFDRERILVRKINKLTLPNEYKYLDYLVRSSQLFRNQEDFPIAQIYEEDNPLSKKR
ncbi:hypothetical protein Tco_1301232 [Tanacetum coccineum]